MPDHRPDTEAPPQGAAVIGALFASVFVLIVAVGAHLILTHGF